MNSINREIPATPVINAVPRVEDQPLVSIICFCKDRAVTIRRSIESVLSQSYRNIEFVVQDGASTDGTVEILQSYQDPRIRLISEPDSGPGEAFWRVLNRCEGKIIGTCLSDEELLPDAVAEAVERFHQNPHVGAITGDGYITDLDGKITGDFIAGEFNIVDYLLGRYCPLWPASFFRKQALLDVGLKSHTWTIECLEFEIWCRLGTQHVVKYFPGRVAKYGVHSTQLSNTAKYFTEHFDHRAKVIRELFSERGFFGADEIKLNGCLYNQIYLLYAHVKAYELKDAADHLAKRLNQIKEKIPISRRVDYMEHFNFVSGTSSVFDSLSPIDRIQFFRNVNQIWCQVALSFSARVRRAIPPGIKRGGRRLLALAVFMLFDTRQFIRYVSKYLKLIAKGESFNRPSTPEFSPKVYSDVAERYYARGQIAQALQLWQRAEVLKDPIIDGMACQAMLMLPHVSSFDLAAMQKNWASRHAIPLTVSVPLKTGPYHGERPIRIGYLSTFFDSYVFRSQLGQVLRERNRAKFKVFGYSTEPVSHDTRKLFDDFKVTGIISDKEFIEVVRQDQIDICIELTGFSPLNRFSAMASRCAPIQVSYLNHTGTSGVENVDYILADDICVPKHEEAFFTERVFRLPGCFFCFNYDWDGVPPVSVPPFEKNGFVTFGTFASGGKLNDCVIAMWAKILHGLPESRLILGNHQLSSICNREYMAARFQRQGIDPQRLKLFSGMDRHACIRLYDEIDVSLDTWPYCGGNSVAEALWQGVPVVTLKGNRFSSRYGASLVTAAGCPELVAMTDQEYVNLAIELGNARDRLRHYRVHLRHMAVESGLSDPKKFAVRLDAAYESMIAPMQVRKDATLVST
jgi:glycosyltransferase involved in cell wall biosynthesis